jgi:hypothetical protein
MGSKWTSPTGGTWATPKQVGESVKPFPEFGTPWSGAVQSSDSYPQLFCPHYMPPCRGGSARAGHTRCCNFHFSAGVRIQQEAFAMASKIWKLTKLLVLSFIGFLIALIGSGLVYRAYEQHEIAKTLRIETPNGINQGSFVKIGGIDPMDHDSRARPR